MENCPNCDSPAIEDLYDGATVFDCGSKTDKFGEIIWHTVDCLFEQVKQLQSWINDLQSGMFINCVYCGHRYGPKEDTPVSMADVLKEHIEKCPKHPMSELKEENKELKIENKKLKEWKNTILKDVDLIPEYETSNLHRLLKRLKEERARTRKAKGKWVDCPECNGEYCCDVCNNMGKILVCPLCGTKAKRCVSEHKGKKVTYLKCFNENCRLFNALDRRN